MPVKVDVLLDGVVTDPPAPLIILHAPVPTVGALAANVTEVNPQVAEVVWSGPATELVGVPLIDILTPLSAPSTAGELLTTLILYPEPFEVPDGIVTEILWLPLASETTVCKSVGEAKEPEASES